MIKKLPIPRCQLFNYNINVNGECDSMNDGIDDPLPANETANSDHAGTNGFPDRPEMTDDNPVVSDHIDAVLQMVSDKEKVVDLSLLQMPTGDRKIEEQKHNISQFRRHEPIQFNEVTSRGGQDGVWRVLDHLQSINLHRHPKSKGEGQTNCRCFCQKNY